MNTIEWLNDQASALVKARESKRPILLEFIKDGCSGCAKMELEVFADPQVAETIAATFTPLRQNIITDRSMRSELGALWTPSFYFLTTNAKLLWFSEGPMNWEDFLVLLITGQARDLLHHGKYLAAVDVLDEAITKNPKHVRTAHLIFLRGMAYYLNYHDKDVFHSAMMEIVEEHPNSPEARMWPWVDQFPKPPPPKT